jgi:hypothetical protein
LLVVIQWGWKQAKCSSRFTLFVVEYPFSWRRKTDHIARMRRIHFME